MRMIKSESTILLGLYVSVKDRDVEVGDHNKCFVGEASTDVVHDYCC